jgi:hypothetical protein
MLRFRRLALGLGALFAASLAVAVPGAVADTLPIHGSTTLTSAHFRITFGGDYAQPDFLPSAKANDLLGFAERAYATYTALGYAPPVDDGDGNGLIEIRAELLVGEPQSRYVGYVQALSPAATTSAGIIHMDVARGIADPTDATKIDAHAIAHELVTLFEWAIFHPTNANDQWVEEASAEWAAFQVANTVWPWPSSLGEADRALDCLGSECGYAQPGIAGYNEYYDRMAKSDWSFMQYLSEKYGNDVVKQILAQRAADGVAVVGTKPVDEILASKGSSLGDAFNGWTATRLNSGFKIKFSGSSVPRPTPFATVKAGFASTSTPVDIPTQIAAVGHLSARYIKIVPGDGDSASNASCSGANLALTVTIPSGVTSAPYVFLDVEGSAPQAMSVSGSTATATIPWSTCSTSAPAYVSLPNATNNPAVNGNEFKLQGKLTITDARPTAPPPPPQTKMPGTVVNVPASDGAPTIRLFGPELLRLSATETVLRLIVSSSGPGTLQASLGSLALGVNSLRTGSNDVRFRLPASALSGLRRFAATSNVLTLTPLSPTGALGAPVTRRVAVEEPVAKPKPAAKPKQTAKPSPKKKTKQRVRR